MEKLSYALGMVIGHNLKGMGVDSLDAADFSKAVADVISGAKTALTDEEAQLLVQGFVEGQNERMGKAVKEAGEKFLADNAKREGVTVLPSGLQYEVLTPAIGVKPLATDEVTCHYEGRLIDGTVFDSSYKRGEPATFPLQGVIAGWTEALQLMAEGAKFRLFIPYQLAYGERGAGQAIPPYAALIFDVELLKVVKH